MVFSSAWNEIIYLHFLSLHGILDKDVHSEFIIIVFYMIVPKAVCIVSYGKWLQPLFLSDLGK